MTIDFASEPQKTEGIEQHFESADRKKCSVS